MDHMMVFTFLYGGHKVTAAAATLEDAREVLFNSVHIPNAIFIHVPVNDIDANLKVIPPEYNKIVH